MCFLTYCVSTVIINTVSVSEPPVLFLSSCGESLAVWQQNGYKSLMSYAHCQAEVWYYISVVGHAEHKQIESINVSFVLFSVRWSVVTVALQSDTIRRQLVVLWIFFTIGLTKYHSDKYVMHTFTFSVTLHWCWGLNSNYCPDWKNFKVPKNSDSQVSQKLRSHPKMQGTRMVTLIKFHPDGLHLLSTTIWNVCAWVFWNFWFVHPYP